MVTLADIQRAQKNLSGVIRATPFEKSLSASELLGSEIFIKFENQQYTGSFKLRGAYHKISSLSSEQKIQGVIASSAGNHAQGVAYSAKVLGVHATIVMPRFASLVKTEATKGYGAEVLLEGEGVDDSIEIAREIEKRTGKTFIHPYEDPLIIAGQGTLGLEILQDFADVDTVIVPIGGGGLISGVARAIKSLKPSVRVIGVVSELAPGMKLLAETHSGAKAVEREKTIRETAFKSYSAPEVSSRDPSGRGPALSRITIADGIAVKSPSSWIYEHFISKDVDQIVSVTDDEIADAIVFLLERMKNLAEGAGAAAMAAALAKKVCLEKKTCILVCGGNIDLNLLERVIERGQLRKGRLFSFSILSHDLPGNLLKAAQVVAQSGANILEVQHDRISEGIGLRETRIRMVVETRDLEHIKKIETELVKAGLPLSQA